MLPARLYLLPKRLRARTAADATASKVPECLWSGKEGFGTRNGRSTQRPASVHLLLVSMAVL